MNLVPSQSFPLVDFEAVNVLLAIFLVKFCLSAVRCRCNCYNYSMITKMLLSVEQVWYMLSTTWYSNLTLGERSFAKSASGG